MACFAVPAAEAIVTTVATKIIQKKESKNGEQCVNSVYKTRFSSKLKWLNNMLWGGSALLCFEHIWHGEIVPFFPFLTAVSNPEDTAAMLREISTAGVAMSVLVTMVWAGMVMVSNMLEKKACQQEQLTTE